MLSSYKRGGFHFAISKTHHHLSDPLSRATIASDRAPRFSQRVLVVFSSSPLTDFT